MEAIEVQRLLQQYFKGESSKEEEKILEKYFRNVPYFIGNAS